jgi:hypothetical protein
VLTGSSAIEVGFTGGADLAEYYTSDTEILAGSIVSLDPASVGGVVLADGLNRPNIVGVVASQPAFIMGVKSETSYPIALSGRVPVRVSTENGLIKAGDRITASSIEGIGMKAFVGSRVVGIALEDLIGESGEIIVFVNPMDGAIAEGITQAQSTVGLDDLGSLELTGALTVGGNATFLGNVVFKSKVEFENAPQFSSSTAGYAVMPKDVHSIDVVFDREYETRPIVTASAIADEGKEMLDVMGQLGTTYILPKQDFIITNVTSKGFTIVLDQPAATELKFAWIAVAVK